MSGRPEEMNAITISGAGPAGLALTRDAMRDYERLWRRELGPMMKTSLVNRYFYARLGESGYVGLLRNISRAGDVRDWLRNYYAPSWLKMLWFQIAKSFPSPRPHMRGVRVNKESRNDNRSSLWHDGG